MIETTIHMLKVSVIVPVFNQDKLLTRCISSVINQTLHDIEIILINDGSTDSSAQICLNFVKQDTRVKYFSLTHQGVGAARNYGIDQSSGEFLCFVDNDDFLDCHFCELMYSMAKASQAKMVCSGIGLLFEDGRRSKLFNPRWSGLVKNLLNQNTKFRAILCNKIYSRELVLRNNIKFSRFPFSEDFAFIFKVYSLIHREHNSIQYVNQPLYFYWRHQGSVTATFQFCLTDSIYKVMGNVESIITFYENNDLTAKNKKIFNRIVVGYFITVRPLDFILFSMLRDKFNLDRNYAYVIRVYFFYQRKYKRLLTIRSKIVRTAILTLIHCLRGFIRVKQFYRKICK